VPGDVQFFVASSVQDGRRILSVYNHLGKLQRMSWRGVRVGACLRGRSGLVMCRGVTDSERNKRRDAGPLLGGENGRHDIVFFEWNGLRQFALRDGGGRPDSGTRNSGRGDQEEIKKTRVVQCWGCRVNGTPTPRY